MVHSSPAQFHHEPSGAFHICGVSADSLDWSHSRRLWPRTDLSLAIGSATGFSVALGNRLELRLSLCFAASMFMAIRFAGRLRNPPAFTVLSFLNTTKYPPSLLFLLMTLGPAMLFLWAVDGTTPRWMRPALVFGKVPMFYYLLHIPLIHLLAIIVCFARYGQVHWMFESPTLGKFPITPPPGWGFSLPIVYLVWAFVVIALYPLCRWFAALKQRRSDAWLSYF